MSLISKTAALVLALVCGAAFAQDGNLVPAPEGVTAKTVLADIQARVDTVQTLKANVEFDRKDDKDDKKKKKKKKADKGASGEEGTNPAWPEPAGREVERGPLEISRGVGARVYLERKKEQEVFVANTTSLWKHDIDDKEARHIPTNWPVIDTFVANAFKINVFSAMDDSTIKLKGSESVDGVPCWLLEGKSPSKLEMVGVESTKMQIWVGKEDGIPRLIGVPSEQDTKVRLKNIQLNTAIESSRYQYKVPEGVETKNILGF